MSGAFGRRGALKSMGAALVASMVPVTLPVTAQAAGRQPHSYLRTNWSRDPFSLGSYSYVAKGARQSDRRALEDPVADRIFFAGEAVFPKRNSTVHAAHESGLRTAELVQETDAQTIAVIGAGMSGLTVAQELAKAGRSVTVLEARDRTGGRLWTNTDLGVPLDMGASWIHGIDDNPLTDLARSVAMKTIVTDDSEVIRGQGGRLLSRSDIADGLIDRTEIQNSIGADPEQVNMSAFLWQSDYDGDEVVFPGGYSAILKALAGDYEVRLSTEVTAVSYGDQGVSLSIKGAAADAFDAVVVTVPLGVLQSGKIEFEPALPAKKARAISRLGMGTLDKLYLLYDAPFWDTDVTWVYTPDTGLPAGQFNLWLNLYPIVDAPVIMAFNGATPALELAKLDDQRLLEVATKVLQGAYPG